MDAVNMPSGISDYFNNQKYRRWPMIGFSGGFKNEVQF